MLTPAETLPQGAGKSYGGSSQHLSARPQSLKIPRLKAQQLEKIQPYLGTSKCLAAHYTHKVLSNPLQLWVVLYLCESHGVGCKLSQADPAYLSLQTLMCDLVL